MQVDLVDLSVASPVVVGPILENGVLLLDRDTERRRSWQRVAREAGVVLVTENTGDFVRIHKHMRFDFIEPWPDPGT